MEKTLKIVSYKDKNVDKLAANEYKRYKDISFWYLDGDLEGYFGDDKAVIYDGVSDDDIETTELGDKVLNLNGKFKVEVYGLPLPCTGFFWTIKENLLIMQRGLVVLDSDKESYRYAEEKFNKKEAML